MRIASRARRIYPWSHPLATTLHRPVEDSMQPQKQIPVCIANATRSKNNSNSDDAICSSRRTSPGRPLLQDTTQLIQLSRRGTRSHLLQVNRIHTLASLRVYPSGTCLLSTTTVADLVPVKRVTKMSTNEGPRNDHTATPIKPTQRKPQRESYHRRGDPPFTQDSIARGEGKRSVVMSFCNAYSRHRPTPMIGHLRVAERGVGVGGL